MGRPQGFINNGLPAPRGSALSLVSSGTGVRLYCERWTCREETDIDLLAIIAAGNGHRLISELEPMWVCWGCQGRKLHMTWPRFAVANDDWQSV
jgi:hypothetical protein